MLSKLLCIFSSVGSHVAKLVLTVKSHIRSYLFSGIYYHFALPGSTVASVNPQCNNKYPQKHLGNNILLYISFRYQGSSHTSMKKICNKGRKMHTTLRL